MESSGFLISTGSAEARPRLGQGWRGGCVIVALKIGEVALPIAIIVAVFLWTCSVTGDHVTEVCVLTELGVLFAIAEGATCDNGLS